MKVSYISSSRRAKLLLFSLVALTCSMWLSHLFCNSDVDYDLLLLDDEVKALRKRVSRLQFRINTLRHQIYSDSHIFYLQERIARHELQLARPREKLFLLKSDDKK